MTAADALYILFIAVLVGLAWWLGAFDFSDVPPGKSKDWRKK